MQAPLDSHVYCRFHCGMQDDGPSEADLVRFGDDAGGHCPECGASIYDDIDRCPACGTYITGAVSRTPRDRAAQRRWVQVVAIVTLIGFLTMVGVLGLVRFF